MKSLRFICNMFAYIFVFYILIGNIPCCNGYNYCSKKAENELCGNNGKHIACHDDILPKDGTLEAIIPMTKKIRNVIVDKHNKFRNEIASGEATSKNSSDKFPKAARMREVLWDYELAYIAQSHAKRCSFHHDKCRKSRRFMAAGQNLGSGDLLQGITLEYMLDVLDGMFTEKERVEHPKEFPKKFTPSLINAGHFSVMVNERTSFVGCGLAICGKPSQQTKRGYYILTCNYEFNNLVDGLIYTTDDSESASQCNHWHTGRSERFKHLCKNNGKILR